MTNSKQIDHLERRAIRKAQYEDSLKAAAEAKKNESIAQLAYFKYIRDMVENDGTTDSVRKSYDEMMKFFNDRIEDLTIDAAGNVRYVYNLEIHETCNGDTEISVEKFKSVEQVHDRIARIAMSSEWMWHERYMDDDDEEPEDCDDVVNDGLTFEELMAKYPKRVPTVDEINKITEEDYRVSSYLCQYGYNCGKTEMNFKIQRIKA
jgi:hypothetical protein